MRRSPAARSAAGPPARLPACRSTASRPESSRARPVAGTALSGNPWYPSVGLVRLRDIGRVEMGAQNYRQAMTFDRCPSVGIAVFQLPGTNALDVAERVRRK